MTGDVRGRGEKDEKIWPLTIRQDIKGESYRS